MNELQSNLVGQKIWLEYYDQNTEFERAFTPQYCTIEGLYADTSGVEDWFLVTLDLPFEYKGFTYDHLMIRSRWVGGQVASPEPTAVFIVLVPDQGELENPFILDRSLYVAWGFTARKKEEIKR